MDPPQHWIHHKFFLSIFFFLIVNLLDLDVLIGKNLLTKTDQQANQAVILPTALPTALPAPLNQLDSQTCSASCLSAINKSVTSLKLTPSPAPQSRARPTLPPTAIPVSQSSATSQKVDSVREFFI